MKQTFSYIPRKHRSVPGRTIMYSIASIAVYYIMIHRFLPAESLLIATLLGVGVMLLIILIISLRAKRNYRIQILGPVTVDENGLVFGIVEHGLPPTVVSLPFDKITEHAPSAADSGIYKISARNTDYLFEEALFDSESAYRAFVAVVEQGLGK